MRKNSLRFVDHKTDSVIQSTMRNELGTDVTILTVAHRLQTIMDADKIVGHLTCVELQCLVNPFYTDGA
jgi:ABC-type transport system involved in Fe-S cluster assembly fused permease/ATPase subunit